ncbi:hypothetical protein, partial [Lactococcus lactis]|uniref:hypothetical protein n=1 Tax=Lactococcus lactis TaxID=1358 RepID=UPI0032E44C93
IVIPPAIFFYYSTLFDSRFKTLQQNQNYFSSSSSLLSERYAIPSIIMTNRNDPKITDIANKIIFPPFYY